MFNHRCKEYFFTSMGKTQEYFKGCFSGAGKHKGEEGNEISFETINF